MAESLVKKKIKSAPLSNVFLAAFSREIQEKEKDEKIYVNILQKVNNIMASQQHQKGTL